MRIKILTCVVLVLVASVVARAGQAVCGVYSSILEFDSRKVLDAAIRTEPSFLMEKHKQSMAGDSDQVSERCAKLRGAGFNTLFLTLYPIHGKDWWAIPAAREMVRDALLNAHAAGLRVHLGVSLFNGNFCDNPGRYKGALQTVQGDGTRPSWVCFFDDALWDYYIKNFVELARLGKQNPGMLSGLFIDPEAYGPECYLCFCDNCVRKYNTWSGQAMPTGLVKPDAWLMARGLWKNYASDWHKHEVRRHAVALRDAVHAIDPGLQLSSLLWDYPVAVGAGDARQEYFRQLVIGLGEDQLPAWTMPEHSYYSDGSDLKRIVKQVEAEINAAGASGRVKILPGVRIVRQSATSLVERGQALRDTGAVGYWLYELADLEPGKGVVDFEGGPVDPLETYWKAIAQMNAIVTSEK
ncbi:MAG TPA: hypothetical protein VFE58_08580 [Tepidisphaeraceae bacterium]|jgi:hypothetical protein|nr:hypothetical protein [Tepidisphaeraceae bacterium]